MSSGIVSLVGAGPGDPELLTLRARDRLQRATLVLFDALVDRRVLALAPLARRFYVGKRAGRHALAQRAIERLMIRAARRGLRVVRLKCGDPFVLGRGGEEVLALRAAGIAYEVIPGVSAALAAPSAFEIPLTHRGLSSAFVVAAGHDAAAVDRLARSVTAGAATLVVLMAQRTRAYLASALIHSGWPASTPTAVIYAAGQQTQELVKVTLGELAELPDHEAPATIVIGEVVSLAAAATCAQLVKVA